MLSWDEVKVDGLMPTIGADGRIQIGSGTAVVRQQTSCFGGPTGIPVSRFRDDPLWVYLCGEGGVGFQIRSGVVLPPDAVPLAHRRAGLTTVHDVRPGVLDAAPSPDHYNHYLPALRISIMTEEFARNMEQCCFCGGARIMRISDSRAPREDRWIDAVECEDCVAGAVAPIGGQLAGRLWRVRLPARLVPWGWETETSCRRCGVSRSGNGYQDIPFHLVYDAGRVCTNCLRDGDCMMKVEGGGGRIMRDSVVDYVLERDGTTEVSFRPPGGGPNLKLIALSVVSPTDRPEPFSNYTPACRPVALEPYQGKRVHHEPLHTTQTSGTLRLAGDVRGTNHLTAKPELTIIDDPNPSCNICNDPRDIHESPAATHPWCDTAALTWRWAANHAYLDDLVPEKDERNMAVVREAVVRFGLSFSRFGPQFEALHYLSKNAMLQYLDDFADAAEDEARLRGTRLGLIGKRLDDYVGDAVAATEREMCDIMRRLLPEPNE